MAGFKGFFTTKELNLRDPDMIRRIKALEQKMREGYDVEEIPNGWKCTARASTQPGFIITKDTLIYVMKNLGV